MLFTIKKKIPVHSDIITPNIVFSNGRLKGLLDSSNVYFDSKMADLSNTIGFEFTDRTGLNFRKAHIFVKAYQRHNNISRKEMMMLPFMMIIVSAASFWHYYYCLRYQPKRKVRMGHMVTEYRKTMWFFKNREKLQKTFCEWLKK